MPRLKTIEPDQAQDKTARMYEQVKKSMGKVPNILKGMGNSPAALGVYLQAKGALAGGVLDKAEAEVIALVTAEVNGCEYCAAAHTGAAKVAGLSAEEAVNIRRGQPTDDKHRVLADFTRRIIDTKGFVEDADVQAMRDAGYDDAAIAETCAHIAVNYYTNIFNHVNDTALDFPAVPEVAR